MQTEEIQIGYRTEEYLEKWKIFLDPLENSDNLWTLPDKPDIRFIQSEREEIIAVVFKVRSLEKSAQYLEGKGLLGIQTGNRIEMDIGWASGIRIILTQ